MKIAELGVLVSHISPLRNVFGPAHSRNPVLYLP
jgi:hypothetical protein